MCESRDTGVSKHLLPWILGVTGFKNGRRCREYRSACSQRVSSAHTEDAGRCACSIVRGVFQVERDSRYQQAPGGTWSGQVRRTEMLGVAFRNGRERAGHAVVQEEVAKAVVPRAKCASVSSRLVHRGFLPRSRPPSYFTLWTGQINRFMIYPRSSPTCG